MNKRPHAFLAVLLLCGLWAAPSASALTVSVARDGSDAADGTPEHPFATLERAREAIRAARQRGESGEVVIHKGTYELRAPLALAAPDSGTDAAPVRWHAAPGEEVRLSAGRNVGGWQAVTEAEVLARLDPEARGSVIQTDLKAQGITDYGEMRGGFAVPSSTGLELFVDDQPMHLSRYPHEGYMTVAQALGATPFVYGGKPSPDASQEGIIRTDDPRVARWVHEKDAQVLGYWAFDWAEERQKIVSIDPAKLTLTLAPPWHQFGYIKGQHFYAYNLLCELHGTGEWYLDRERGILYLFRPEGAPSRAMVSLLPSVVVMEGVSHVEFSGFTFEGARTDAVKMARCEACVVADGVLRNGGSWAVRVEDGHRCAVRGCAIYNTGDGGVSLTGGDRATLTPAGHEVVNCDIHDYSRWNRTYQPAIKLVGVGCRATHNLVHDAPHQGMEFEGNDHVIESNEIHDVCRESNDVGAIYAWNDWSGRGNQIRFNYFHHILGWKNKGANGVYLDDNFSSALIEGNVFVSVTRPIHLGGGRDHQVLNNLFVDCTSTLHIDARGLSWHASQFPVLKAKLQAMPYEKPPWSERYPKLVGMLDDEPMAPKGVVVERNVLISSPNDDITTDALPFLTIRDNLFDAPRALLAEGPGTPHLKDGAPELANIKFQPIPWERIGPRK